MNIHTAYTIYNNAIQSVKPQLGEAIDRIIDDKNKQLEKLDKVELAEVKARIEIEAGEGYLTALLKKRIHQNYDLQDENERLREALTIILEDEAPNCDGYETLIYATARKALAGESK